MPITDATNARSTDSQMVDKNSLISQQCIIVVRKVKQSVNNPRGTYVFTVSDGCLCQLFGVCLFLFSCALRARWERHRVNCSCFVLWSCQGRPSPPEAMMHFPPLFQIPPIFEKVLDFSRKNYPFSSAKISDDLFFSHQPQISDFPPILPVLVHFPPDSQKIIISPHLLPISPCSKKFTAFYILCVFPPPTLTMMHLCIHHPMHVLDAPVLWPRCA